MAIVITPEEVNLPDYSDEQKEDAIALAIAYAELWAPCINDLTGSVQLVAKNIIIKAIELTNSSSYGEDSLKIGPFTTEASSYANKNINYFFPKDLLSQLMALCGQSSVSFGKMEINRLGGCGCGHKKHSHCDEFCGCRPDWLDGDYTAVEEG